MRWNKHSAVRGDGDWRHFWLQAVHQRQAGRIISSAASQLSQQNNGTTTPTTQQNGGISLSSITSMQSGLNQPGHSDKARICQRDTFSKLLPAIALNASIRSVRAKNSVAAEKALGMVNGRQTRNRSEATACKDNTTFTNRNHNRSPTPHKRKRANLAVGSSLHITCSASGISSTHQRLLLSG